MQTGCLCLSIQLINRQVKDYSKILSEADGDGVTWREAYGKVLGTVLVASLLEAALSFVPPKTLRKLFPPLVTGTAVFLIGASLVGTGIRYAFYNLLEPCTPAYVTALQSSLTGSPRYFPPFLAPLLTSKAYLVHKITPMLRSYIPDACPCSGQWALHPHLLGSHISPCQDRLG